MSYYDSLRHVIYRSLPLVILAEMKHYFRGHGAVRAGDVQTFGHQEFDSNVLKSALLHRHVLHDPKLVLTHGVGLEPKRPYTTDGAVARCNQVTVEYDGACPFGRRRTRNFVHPHFPFEVVLRSIGWSSFTLKSACVFRSLISREALLSRVT